MGSKHKQIESSTLLNIEAKYNHRSAQKIINENNKYIITNYISGTDIDVDFVKSIKKYCAANKALFIIIPIMGKEDDNISEIPFEIRDELFVFDEVSINKNLVLSEVRVSPSNVNPLTGLQRIGDRERSIIISSPKQMLKMVPNNKGSVPHAMMSTSSISLPNYYKNGKKSAAAIKATHDHKVGAIIVKKSSPKIFHYRQVQSINGGFYDYDKRYDPTKITKIRAEAFVMGDWHSGSTCPFAQKIWERVVKASKPKKLFVHDFFDGFTINPHEADNAVLSAKRAHEGENLLENEIELCARDLHKISAWADEIFVVKSNHDLFLNRYLDKGLFISRDPANALYASKILVKYLEGKDPLEFAIREKAKELNLSLNNVLFLSEESSMRIEGIECAVHGHRGANGAKGSITSHENSYGAITFGHTHTPEILRDAWSGGTSTLLNLGYNTGASSWVRASSLIFPGGGRQILNIIEDELEV